MLFPSSLVIYKITDTILSYPEHMGNFKALLNSIFGGCKWKAYHYWGTYLRLSLEKINEETGKEH